LTPVMVSAGTPENLKKKSGLNNVLTIETVIKTDPVRDILQQFSDREKILETEKGYRIYCENPDEVLPHVVRALDSIGCTKTKTAVEAPSLEDVFFALTEKPVIQ